MFTVKFNDEIKEFNSPTKIMDMFDNKEYKYQAANVNNRLRELTFAIDRDCTINLLDLSNNEAARIHEASLRYLMAMALENINPNAKIEFNYSISRSIMCRITDMNMAIDDKLVEIIKKEMDRIIECDYPIYRKSISLEEAKKIYAAMNYQEKVDVLAFRPDDTVNLYTCNGYINYMFGYMVPSTGYLKDYRLSPYYPGIVLQYPRADLGGKIPKFEDAPRFNKTLYEAFEWTKTCDGGYISKINNHVLQGTAIDFINMCETKHNNMLAEIGEIISNNRRNVRLIAIAGPSSSGKTTFSMRLKIELMTRGLKPIMISIDDFYLPRSEAPIDEYGKPDLEHINALDIALFNKNMLSLVQGETVTLPRFNFKTGEREKGKTVHVGENEPIIIEGIHALNETLTSLIPRHQKFKIYIGPLIQMHIDNHNPINMTDIRLLRRLVRDRKFRDTEAKRTFAMWPSVRRGEFRWIYPTQEEADYVFNSELSYEISVLKKHALAMLGEIDHEDPLYIQANRLVKFLKYFIDIEDTWVPCNSLLREFIGGSCFHINE